ncbi:sigma-70 family RNA polymerase sigma factor [Streptomyces gobiensis]|uniref:sigma-70 family RNA polymerase sigma factor n=1 Tax=Streptomyces gobiensis TaxID=2875706 RepID=UPI001E42DB14|nr:sigma-70 family RNA polymerase sigma factor [Streptomyces gobiensis]UGY92271.1 sigma-70 family RNA polymerase sigma factor [Streptomyces gobiensis]
MTKETERWLRIWSHREQLLKVARRRSVSMDDAEDAVHEAMVRASERPHLDDERLGGWLTTVTIRLCVDRHRQLNRDAAVGSRSAHTVVVPVEEAVCDRAEASWLARRSCDLPVRQAEALWLKAEDLDVGQVARKMGLNYRTVESLLARARRTLRNSLAGTLALTLWLIGRRPRTGGSGVQAMGAVSTVATLAVLGLALPSSSPPPDSGKPRQPATSHADTPSPGDFGRTGSGRNPSPWPPAARESGPSPSPSRSGMSLLDLELPEVEVPEVPALTDVPDVPNMPDIPSVPDLPNTHLPNTHLPDAPSLPDTPSLPGLPEAGEIPDVSESPDVPLPLPSSSAPSSGSPRPSMDAPTDLPVNPSGNLPDIP